MFLGVGLPFKRLKCPGRSITDEPASSGADRSTGRSGRRPAISQRPGAVRRRSQARGHAARGGAAQPRGAWPHPRDRRVRRASHARRSRGHHRRGDRRGAGDPAAARQSAGVQAYLQPVIAKDKVRYVGEPLAVVVAETPGARRGCARGDRRRYRAAAGAAGSACGGARQVAAVRSGLQQSRDALCGVVRRCRRGIRQGANTRVKRDLSLPPPDRAAAGDPRLRSPNGTPTRPGSRSSARPRCCSSTAGCWRRCSALPRPTST